MYKMGVPTFMVETQRFTDSATARKYIRNLAMRFEDPEDMSAFLALCDIAQAALAYCAIEKTRYRRSNQTHPKSKNEIKYSTRVKQIAAYKDYRKALAELVLTKKKLCKLVNKLDAEL